MKYPTHSVNEVFIGNTKQVGNHLSPLSTLRISATAYDIDGNPLAGYLSMFIDKSELSDYDNIMMARIRAARNGSTT